MDDAEDRLSELSNEVIHLIFSKLQTRDVVRTTILSKRWVNLWTTITSLDFEIYNSETHINFINRVLERLIAAKIKSFRIKIKTYLYWGKPVYVVMRTWVSFAIDRNVEDLQILNQILTCDEPNGSYNPEEYDNEDDPDEPMFDRDHVYDLPYFPPPESLYSSSSIRTLTLSGCYVEIPSDVCLSQLKCLVVDESLMDGDMISRVVAGSPKLEALFLYHWGRPKNLNIRSSSLKILKLDSRDHHPEDELTIWAPKLEVLKIYGCSYMKCLLMDMFSLNTVVLGFEEAEQFDDMEETERGELLEETLRQILPAIQYAKVVKLSSDCSEVLIEMEGEIPSFSNVKLLDIAPFTVHELEDIVGILETFPKLERLIVSWYANSNRHLIVEDLQDVGEHSINLEPVMTHLTTVDILSRHYDESILGFIQSILENATEMRKIVIRNTGYPENESRFREMVEKQSASLQSSFPNLKLVFCQNRSW